MILKSIDNWLNVGIYTPSEAALYARVSPQMLTRWLGWSRQGEGVIEPELGDESRLVSFLDFVQALSIREIRNTYRIPLQRIREAVEVAKSRYGVEYPFAVRHKTYVFGDLANAPWKASVLIQLDSPDRLVEIAGRHKGNLVMAEVAELHMNDLYFGDENLASAYVAWNDGQRKIVMDPQRQFGDPMVAGTGYSAQALWHAYISEGGVEAAAKAYGVETEDIALAIRYYDHLQGPSPLRGKAKNSV